MILGDQGGQEVLEVGQSGYWDGPKAWNGDFPRACGEEPELEVMLGFFPQLLGLRQICVCAGLGVGWGVAQSGKSSQADETWFSLGSGDDLLGPVPSVSSQGCYRGPLT